MQHLIIHVSYLLIQATLLLCERLREENIILVPCNRSSDKTNPAVLSAPRQLIVADCVKIEAFFQPLEVTIRCNLRNQNGYLKNK